MSKGEGKKGGYAAASGREHVRTDDSIPVYYEIDRGDDGPEVLMDWEKLFEEMDPRPEENPKVYELLFDISQKVNILINYLSDKNGFNIPEAREVNISGGGLRFFSNETFDVGEKLVLKTFLPTHAHIIKLKCEVVRSIARDGGGYEVAVKYTDMDETTREKIIKYIFARQRKLLRSEKDTPPENN